MSEKYYKRLHLTKIHSLQNVNVKSATGSNLAPVGLVNCIFELGKIEFNSKFIVCKNLTRPLILGRHFLIQNHVSIRYSENGKCILDYQQQELIASLNFFIAYGLGPRPLLHPYVYAIGLGPRPSYIFPLTKTAYEMGK